MKTWFARAAEHLARERVRDAAEQILAALDVLIKASQCTCRDYLRSILRW